MRQNRGFKTIYVNGKPYDFQQVEGLWQLTIDGKTYTAISRDRLRRLALKVLKASTTASPGATPSD